MNQISCCLLTLWLAWTGAVAAAEPPLLSEEEFVADLPVVLAASRLAQPLSEAPAAVTVIDRQMIEASGVRNLSELFRLVPGFVVGFESGHRQVVSYHGLSDQFSRRLQVLIDGRSVYLPSFGGVSWSDLPLVLDDIERIEVIRGPNAASYGANAFLATLNITTRHAASTPGGFVRASAGSNDIRDGVLRAAGGDDNVQYRLTTAYQQDSGTPQRNDSREITLLNARVDWRAGARDDVEYQFGYNQGPRGRGDPADIVNPPHDQEITSRFQQIRWRHRLDNGGEWSLQFYHNHHESDEQIVTGPIAIPIPPFAVQIPVNFDVRSERNDVEFQHLHPWGPVRVVWGLGARVDRVEWPGFLGTADPVVNREYRLFGNLEWRITDRWVVNAGAMVENNDITGRDLSPRLAVNHHLAPGHTLRAAVSSATRNPVLLEEQSFARFCAPPSCLLFDQTFASSGNLEPERILASELGYLGRLSHFVTLDVRLFRDQVTKLVGIYTIPYPADPWDGDARDFRNSDKAMLTGVETQLQWQPERDTRMILGYANVAIESSDIDAGYSRSAPRNSLSLLVLHGFAQHWQASAVYYYQDRMTFIDGDEIEPLRRLDLRLARRFRFGDAAGEVAVVLQNILFGEQATYTSTSLAGPAGYATVSLQFR